MPSSRKKPLKVFIDSSVFFAAVLSPSGGSFRIFREAKGRNIYIYVSQYVVDEVERELTERYWDSLDRFRSFFIYFPIVVNANPPLRFTNKYLSLLPPEDAPILSAAVNSGAIYLLTLDKKHFLIPLNKIALPVKVVTPGDFIQKYFV